MAASAPVAVCCPNCWRWSELKHSTACKRCGAPLVLPDGRRVDEALDGTAPSVVSRNAPTVSLSTPMVGIDWIAIARWITAAYGALTILTIFAVGLLVPSLTIPVGDPNTGQIVDQTVNIRPILAIAALILIAFYAGIVVAIGHGIARVILMIVVLLGAFAALSRIGAEPSTAVAGSVVSLILDAGFAYVLAMTFIAPRRAAPAGSGAPIAIAPPPPPPPPPPPSQPEPPPPPPPLP